MSKPAIKTAALAFLFFAFTVGVITVIAKTANAQVANLISNPSVETAGTPSSIPLNWSSNKWGTSTAAFSYPSTGAQDGSRSVAVTVSGYASGDAKWFFNTVDVQPNSDYVFTDYYKSTVPTRAVAMSVNAAGVPTYFDLSINIATSASGWTQFSAPVRTLASTQTLTVFHLIDRNGTLEIDNASLTYVPPVQQTTIIPNPSLETATAGNPNMPKDWRHHAWGNNTRTYSYSSSGAQDGTRSAKVTVSNYIDGDAAWEFMPQEGLTAGTNYTYKVWYKGTIQPHVVARYERADGSEYFYGMTQPAMATSSWQLYTGTFTVPSDAAKVSTYMFIMGNGSIEIDNASIIETAGPATIVPNPSLETAAAGDSTTPQGWYRAGWGTNSPTYEYLSTGAHAGSKSVKITMANYVDGDASWAFEPQVLTNGADYQFSVWYKTNTIPHVVARFERADGSEYFFGISDPEPTGTGWQQYKGVFNVPADAVKVSAYMFISNDGWLQTDSYSITPYTYEPFNRGLVTMVFDDGYEENIATAIPTMGLYGFKSTQCAATQFIEGFPAQVAKIQSMAAAGHEICSHTVTHPNLTAIPIADVDYELNHAKTFLQSITGQSIENFASPYGASNAAVKAKIALYQNSHRTTDEGYNAKDTFNKYHLKVQNMQQGTTLAEFQSWVNKAKNDKTWLILVYHVVAPAPTEQFDTIQSDFDAQMLWLSTAGVTVKTWGDALNEITPQL
ncbi:MAG TPA: polysaccharide deacetylase family protein [Candidatus Paceibacterota bacterium]|nr:polysaccharide deacetylase family protein [Candidatus Paceibacterota bacterium]